MKKGQLLSHTKTRIKDNIYAIVQVKETIINSAEITHFNSVINAIITHIGINNQIKFIIDNIEYISKNPFMNYIDKRQCEPIYAVSNDMPNHFKVIDLTNVKFDLSALKMTELFSRFYGDDDVEWIEIPEEYKIN